MMAGHPAASLASPLSVIARDLTAASEDQNDDGRASTSKTRHSCVRDLVAVKEVQRGDSNASSSQTRQPCARDLFAVKEVQSGDSNASSSQTLCVASKWLVSWKD